MTTPLISLIVPAYNRPDLLLEAVDSVRRQQFTDFELIIVDDGSTDRTPAVLSALASAWDGPPLRVLRQPNSGQGAARNLGIAHARGDYCAFLDSDDLLFPWSLKVIADAIRDGGFPPVVLGDEFRFFKQHDYSEVQDKALEYTVWPDLYQFAMQRPIRGAGETVVRTDLLKRVGGFFSGRVIGEDTDLLLRLGVEPNLVKIESPATYGYRMHGEMFSRNSAAYRGVSSLIRRCETGVFPGGREREKELHTLMARIGSLHAVNYLIAGSQWKYLMLSLKSAHYQARAGHYRYLVTIPVRFLLGSVGLWPLRARHRAYLREMLARGPEAMVRSEKKHADLAREKAIQLAISSGRLVSRSTVPSSPLP